MDRRTMLRGLMAVPLMGLAEHGFGQTGAKEAKGLEDLQKNWRTFLAEGADVAISTEPLKRSNAEWRKLLTPAQYNILREEGTEYAGTSPLDSEKRPGVFVCAACSLPLFTSAMKYDSGTGWPSFFTTIPGVFGIKRDHMLILPRTEYHCIRCGGHQGHIFDDGPAPTGLRYCNNGIGLRFIPKARKA